MEIVLLAHPDVSLPPQSGRPASQEDIVSHSDLFQRGQCVELVEMSLISSVEAESASARRRRRFKGDDVEQRARRAFHMVQLGEVSAGRQALDGACLAPGDLKTQKALEDPTRRSPVPRDPLPDSVAQCEPEEHRSCSCRMCAGHAKAQHQDHLE